MMLELIVCGLFPGSHVFDRYGKHLPGVNDVRANAVGFTESAKAHTVGAGNGTPASRQPEPRVSYRMSWERPRRRPKRCWQKGRRTSLRNDQLLPDLKSSGIQARIGFKDGLDRRLIGRCDAPKHLSGTHHMFHEFALDRGWSAAGRIGRASTLIAGLIFNRNRFFLSRLDGPLARWSGLKIRRLSGLNGRDDRAQWELCSMDCLRWAWSLPAPSPQIHYKSPLADSVGCRG